MIWIDPSYTYAYIIDLKKNSTLPVSIKISELELEIETNKLVEIIDPYAKVLNENEIPEYLKMGRDKSWEVVQYLWNTEHPKILRKNYRSDCIRQASEKFNISIYKVERIMKRFWQRGMTKNSIILDYSNSGAKGKEKGVSEKKRGRPRKAEINGSSIEGINIDENLKIFLK